MNFIDVGQIIKLRTNKLYNFTYFQNAADLLATAKNPVIITGGGVVMAEDGAVDAGVKLAEQLQAPVCTTYLHNDAFPKSHPLLMGPLGYQVIMK